MELNEKSQYIKDKLDIERMLNQVNTVSIKHETIAQATGSQFNIFETTNISENEVLMCRVLAELLNPKGSHGQGRVYLDLFFEIVLGVDIPSQPVIVEREEVIDGYRRIDIVIKYDGCIIPIEVKINASDQLNQLFDYSQKSKGIENPKVYYLTKFGHEPSENSCCSCQSKEEKLQKTDIGCISWEVHILEWLEACILHQITLTRAPIREVLLQFSSAIRRFTGQIEENERMDIEQLLLKSSKNMKNAHKIEMALLGAKKELLKKFHESLLRELEIKVGKPNEGDTLSNDILKDWNIGYKLGVKENDILVARISFENKTIVQLVQVLSNDWQKWRRDEYKNKLFSLTDDTFFNLANEEELKKSVDSCINWIKEKIEKNANTTMS